MTEGITGINIPACQLMIGMGVPLWRMPTVRALYGQDPKGDSPFDLEVTPQKPADCHVFAVRITAEDANEGFKVGVLHHACMHACCCMGGRGRHCGQRERWCNRWRDRPSSASKPCMSVGQGV